MVGNLVKELNIPKTLVLRERGKIQRDMSGPNEGDGKEFQKGD